MAIKPTIRLQPLPVLTMMGELRGITSITRQWADGDHRRCSLCEPGTCGASDGGICTVLTDEEVSESEAPTYSRVGSDVEERTTFAPAVFGRSF